MEILIPQSQLYYLSIAGLTIQLETDRTLSSGENFLPFLTGGGCPDYRALFRKVDALPPIPNEVLYEELDYRVHPDDRGGYLRSFFDPRGDESPYAVASFDFAQGVIQVDYLAKEAHCVSEIQNSFFHLGFESLLIHKNRLCLHAACIQTSFGGLLFSGPSGVGKSTQAELWCSLRGARQINGDRPILSKDQNFWLAWGSPYAGSSQCHINENCTVTAIVMLRQAEECSLRRLSMPEAFRAVWSGLTVYSWDKTYVETASSLAMELIASVPVWELDCTPDARAVEVLEQGLRKECGL